MKLFSDLTSSSKLFSELKKRYQEPHRKFHTLEHVKDLLKKSEIFYLKFEERQILTLAIFYHDAIYDIHRSDNEEKSASLLRSCGPYLNLPEEIVESASKLIQDTQAINLFNALDYSILASNENLYEDYKSKIYEEYQVIPRTIFTTKRIEILSSLRSKIKRFKLINEIPGCSLSQANYNLSLEIELLKGGSWTSQMR